MFIPSTASLWALCLVRASITSWILQSSFWMRTCCWLGGSVWMRTGNTRLLRNLLTINLFAFSTQGRTEAQNKQMHNLPLTDDSFLSEHKALKRLSAGPQTSLLWISIGSHSGSTRNNCSLSQQLCRNEGQDKRKNLIKTLSVATTVINHSLCYFELSVTSLHTRAKGTDALKSSLLLPQSKKKVFFEALQYMSSSQRLTIIPCHSQTVRRWKSKSSIASASRMILPEGFQVLQVAQAGSS